MAVTLEEITEDTLNDVLALSVNPEQARIAEAVSVSIARAYFARNAWFRAIYADKTPVGFVMLDLDSLKPMYSIRQFLIDRRYQRRGYGSAAMEHVIEFVKTLPESRELYVTCPGKEGSPMAFCRKFGFTETGAVKNGNPVMRLVLND